ncbi:MAG: hypothetical protein AAB514_01725 [Patescibacteria group bacterium]
MKCRTCDCITPGTTNKCPNCDEDPSAIPESYSKNEWYGRKLLFFPKRKEEGSLESLINNEKII